MECNTSLCIVCIGSKRCKNCICLSRTVALCALIKKINNTVCLFSPEQHSFFISLFFLAYQKFAIYFNSKIIIPISISHGRIYVMPLLIWLHFYDLMDLDKRLSDICNRNNIMMLLLISSSWHRDCPIDRCKIKNNHTNKEVNLCHNQ